VNSGVPNGVNGPRDCHAEGMNLAGIGIVLIVGVLAAVIGIAFGIVILAPRITRLLDRPGPDDEEPVDRPD
jgi:hypothetical protein